MEQPIWHGYPSSSYELLHHRQLGQHVTHIFQALNAFYIFSNLIQDVLSDILNSEPLINPDNLSSQTLTLSYTTHE